MSWWNSLCSLPSTIFCNLPARARILIRLMFHFFFFCKIIYSVALFYFLLNIMSVLSFFIFLSSLVLFHLDVLITVDTCCLVPLVDWELMFQIAFFLIISWVFVVFQIWILALFLKHPYWVKKNKIVPICSHCYYLSFNA